MSRKPLGRRLSSIGLLIVATFGSVLCLSQSSEGQQAPKEPKASKEQQAPKEQQASKGQQAVTAEQVAESAIAVAGNGFGRAVLAQIRRNGLEVGKETR